MIFTLGISQRLCWDLPTLHFASNPIYVNHVTQLEGLCSSSIKVATFFLLRMMQESPQQNLALLLTESQVWQTLNKVLKLINPSNLINFVASLVLKCNQRMRRHPNHDLKTNFYYTNPMWIHLQNQIENFSYVNLCILNLLALAAQWASRFFPNKHSWGGHSLYILGNTSNYKVF
jgi:hypothetical protein